MRDSNLNLASVNKNFEFFAFFFGWGACDNWGVKVIGDRNLQQNR